MGQRPLLLGHGTLHSGSHGGYSHTSKTVVTSESASAKAQRQQTGPGGRARAYLELRVDFGNPGGLAAVGKEELVQLPSARFQGSHDRLELRVDGTVASQRCVGPGKATSALARRHASLGGETNDGPRPRSGGDVVRLDRRKCFLLVLLLVAVLAVVCWPWVANRPARGVLLSRGRGCAAAAPLAWHRQHAGTWECAAPMRLLCRQRERGGQQGVVVKERLGLPFFRGRGDAATVDRSNVLPRDPLPWGGAMLLFPFYTLKKPEAVNAMRRKRMLESAPLSLETSSTAR